MLSFQVLIVNNYGGNRMIIAIIDDDNRGKICCSCAWRNCKSWHPFANDPMEDKKHCFFPCFFLFPAFFASPKINSKRHPPRFPILSSVFLYISFSPSLATWASVWCWYISATGGSSRVETSFFSYLFFTSDVCSWLMSRYMSSTRPDISFYFPNLASDNSLHDYLCTIP